LKRNIPPVLLGQSEFDPKYFAVAMELVEKHSDKLVLPIDFVYGQKDGQIQSPDEGLVMDLGPETIELFAKEVDQAKTIFWNGPVGYVEQENFAKATNELAKHIAASKAMSVVGGGDTVGNLDTKLQQEFDFVSMGGEQRWIFWLGRVMRGSFEEVNLAFVSVVSIAVLVSLVWAAKITLRESIDDDK
jgi:phosphoglycerate kinase